MTDNLSKGQKRRLLRRQRKQQIYVGLFVVIPAVVFLEVRLNRIGSSSLYGLLVLLPVALLVLMIKMFQRAYVCPICGRKLVGSWQCFACDERFGPGTPTLGGAGTCMKCNGNGQCYPDVIKIPYFAISMLLGLVGGSVVSEILFQVTPANQTLLYVITFYPSWGILTLSFCKLGDRIGKPYFLKPCPDCQVFEDPGER